MEMAGCVVNERKGNSKAQALSHMSSMCTCVQLTGERGWFPRGEYVASLKAGQNSCNLLLSTFPKCCVCCWWYPRWFSAVP